MAEARSTRSDYEKQLRIQWEEAWNLKKTELETNLLESEKAGGVTAFTEGEAMIASARELEDANAAAFADDTLELAQLDRDQKEEELKRYQELQAADGKLYAKGTMSVTKIRTASGERTTDSAVMLMADVETGYRFHAEITKEQKKYVAAGDAAELLLGSEERKITDIPIESIEEDGERTGVYHVYLPVTSEMGKIGETGSMTLCQAAEEGEPVFNRISIFQTGEREL